MAANRIPGMSKAFYRVLITVLLLLSLSGVVWMALHYFFAEQTPFGTAPNSYEPTLMRVHGIVAVAAVFLMGGIATGHVVDAWSQLRNRLSGLTLAIACGLLIISGYANYYLTSDSLHSGVAIAHEAVGILAIALALIHWTNRRN
jgi:uncharacterized membrane protein YjgN (DUF898 family)